MIIKNKMGLEERSEKIVNFDSEFQVLICRLSDLSIYLDKSFKSGYEPIFFEYKNGNNDIIDDNNIGCIVIFRKMSVKNVINK
jgi:hypothetical protein